LIKEIKDKSILYERFKEDVFLFAYHIGDLDDFFFSDCTWFGLEEHGQLKEVILLYTGLDVPSLLIFGSNEKIPALINGIISKLPDRFYCHYQEDFHKFLESAYQMKFLGDHLKMKFQRDLKDFIKIDTSEIISLNEDDNSTLLSLYQTAYPGSYFVPYMLKTGKYYGIKAKENLVSVAGVHVFSPRYNIAVLGNITTHPAFRGKGLANRCITRLLKSFDGVIDRIGLNVKKDNHNAIRLYKKLGFDIHTSYREAYFEKNP
jgi:GNAT superfamily N-acetyltransferase